MTPEERAELEAILGHQFQRPEELDRALTHRSLAHQLAQADTGKKSAPADNERLEYLGDAVLGLAVAEALFALHPEWRNSEKTAFKEREKPVEFMLLTLQFQLDSTYTGRGKR